MNTDPDVAATIRLLHGRQGWSRAVITGFTGSAVTYGAYTYAQDQGSTPPTWFLAIAIALGALTLGSIVAVAVDSALLRRRPPAVMARAAPLAARHPSRPHARYYPPRHLVSWVLRWLGMLVILAVAVISVPGVVDGAAYLAGAGRMVTFDPVSYQTNCDRYSCQTTTDGILETGGPGVDATWPAVVPLGTPFKVREPVWRWGIGLALIDSDSTAIIAVVVCLLMEGFAVVVAISIVMLARSWLRHRRQRTAPASVSIP